MKSSNLAKLLIAGLAFSVSNLSAQNSEILDSYIRTGLESNLALRQQQLDLNKAQEAIRQSRALFYPTLQFNANYTRATGGRSIDIPVGDLLNPVYSTLNLITQTNAFPTISNENVQFLPDDFHETKIKVAYPLFNSDLRYNRQIKTQLYESKAAQKSAYEHELRYRITEAYLQYLQSLEAEKIWQHSRDVLVELRRFNESLVNNQVATKDIVATADYELSKADNELFKLQQTQQTARAYFNFLINRDLQSDITVDTSLLRGAAGNYETEEMIRQAFASRYEFNALSAGKNAAETAVKLNAANLRIPDFYIGAEAGFQGFGYKFNGEQSYALAQIGLSYDLFDAGMRKSKTQEARIEAEVIETRYQEVRQQIALEVIDASNSYAAAKHSYETTQSGLRAAEASFRIINNKYRANQALLIEYLDAQNRVTTAQLQVALALTDVLIREAALKKAAGM
ncbi:MAG: TolC family protein [Lewinellaceae bacterium]|nr:TolC family protein [Lewinellaceae bacterium]